MQTPLSADATKTYIDRINAALLRFSLSGFFAMFKALFGRNVAADHAHALYGSVVARSRDVRFYADYGVPDSFDGRFEMLVMHLFLLHHRLKNEDQMSRKVSQRVFDAFIDDMDSALREAAVGDQTVTKRIAKMTQVFYGRTGAYEAALAATDVQLEVQGVISRNLYPGEESHGRELPLTDYFLWQHDNLASKSAKEIIVQNQAYVGPLLDLEFSRA